MTRSTGARAGVSTLLARGEPEPDLRDALSALRVVGIVQHEPGYGQPRRTLQHEGRTLALTRAVPAPIVTADAASRALHAGMLELALARAREREALNWARERMEGYDPMLQRMTRRVLTDSARSTERPSRT